MYVVLPALYYLTLRRRAIAYLIESTANKFCHERGLSSKYLSILYSEFSATRLAGILLGHACPRPLGPLLFSCLYAVHSSQLYRPTMPSFWIGWIFCLTIRLASNFFHDSPANYTYRRCNEGIRSTLMGYT